MEGNYNNLSLNEFLFNEMPETVTNFKLNKRMIKNLITKIMTLWLTTF